jgi:Protein of unknown function (DUF2490)
MVPGGQVKSSKRARGPFGRIYLTAVFLLPLFVLPRLARGQAKSQYPSRDTQGWTDLDATHPLRENLFLTVNGGLRLSEDAGHLVYRRVGGGLVWKVSKYLTLSPYYNFYDTDSSPVRESRENRIALAVTPGISLGSWKIADRNLFERRFLIGGPSWRYRNQVQVTRRIHLARSELRLFVWDEVFYDSIPHVWVRNRAALGAGKALSKRLSVDLYFVRQNDSHTRPGDLNAIGVFFHTRF